MHTYKIHNPLYTHTCTYVQCWFYSPSARHAGCTAHAAISTPIAKWPDHDCSLAALRKLAEAMRLKVCRGHKPRYI